jgi:3-isopropylmalate/(R)-2-methylmalate dehydratase large subunit
MGMTITEKLLAAHCGRDRVEPGELIEAGLDLALANDITAPLAIAEFEKAGAEQVWDRTKIALVPDHFTPNKDIAAATNVKDIREFAKKHKIAHFFECSQVGIEHALLPEQGLVLPGDLVIGADSHTCTYGALGAFATGVGSTDLAAAMVTGKTWLKVPESARFVFSGELKPWVSGKDLILYTIGQIGVDGALYQAMEFTGPTIAKLAMASRFTICNMAVEAGAKSGIVAPDDRTRTFLRGRSPRKGVFLASDPDARYARTLEIDAGKIELQVALPSLPSNAKPVAEVKDLAIDQAVIGSCTNGWLEDLRVAAKVLEGKRIAPWVRLIVIPATRIIYRQAMREGLMDVFMDAGAVISPPTCGPCLGGHMGVLAEGERAVATTNRNFAGRMGHRRSEVVLAGPAVAAASAVLGRVGSPEELK